MAGRFLLDTNVAIAVLEDDPAARERIGQADEVYVSVVALGELYLGARRSGRVTENVARVDELARRTPVIDCDHDTARQYGIIKRSLLEKGCPIPDNDIWIAALAREHGLILLTRDAHFAEVERLRVEGW